MSSIITRNVAKENEERNTRQRVDKQINIDKVFPPFPWDKLKAH